MSIDGYHWGASETWSSWTSPAAVFGDMTARMRAVTGKPVGITETASTTSGGTVAAKNQWVGDLFAWSLQAGVRMVAWFNEDKDTDWAVFGGSRGDVTFRYGRTTYRAYSTYAAAVRPPAPVGPTPSNPRLLTDAEFAGHCACGADRLTRTGRPYRLRRRATAMPAVAATAAAPTTAAATLARLRRSARPVSLSATVVASAPARFRAVRAVFLARFATCVPARLASFSPSWRTRAAAAAAWRPAFAAILRTFAMFRPPESTSTAGTPARCRQCI